MPLFLIEYLDALMPGGALEVVDLAPVEDVTLHDGASETPILDDRPESTLPAVLPVRAALEKPLTLWRLSEEVILEFNRLLKGWGAISAMPTARGCLTG